MLPIIKKSTRITDCENLIMLASAPDQLDSDFFSIDEFDYITRQFSKEKKDFIILNRYTHMAFVVFLRDSTEKSKNLEKWRRYGDQLASQAKENKLLKLVISHVNDDTPAILAFAEGLALGSYQFLKYKSDKEDKAIKLKELALRSKSIDQLAIDRLNILLIAVSKCRDLVNEPLSYLTAEKLAGEIDEMGKLSGAKVEILTKLKIESLKMGGLLAVNKGSLEEPTFSIMEWKPEHPVNNKPLVFVGKGVVFDTGGINLKSYESMLTMKNDMAGGCSCCLCVICHCFRENPCSCCCSYSCY